jgi:hypothetical protein
MEHETNIFGLLSLPSASFLQSFNPSYSSSPPHSRLPSVFPSPSFLGLTFSVFPSQSLLLQLCSSGSPPQCLLFSLFNSVSYLVSAPQSLLFRFFVSPPKSLLLSLSSSVSPQYLLLSVPSSAFPPQYFLLTLPSSISSL